MRPEDLAERLHRQAVQILALVSSLPHRLEWQATFAQLCRCAPSASDNYRSACRGRSRKEFVARLGVAADEADETVGWLQIMNDSGIGPKEKVSLLLEEAVELRAILAKSYKTARKNLNALERKKTLERRKRRPNQ
jgi:four helix bundle protein